MAAGNAHLLHRILRGADAGGVEQRDRHPLQHDLAFQQIASGAGQIRHDRPLTPTEAIEQGALAHIGATDQCHPQSLAQSGAALSVLHELQQRTPHIQQLPQQRRTIKGRQILLEIHPGLQFTELIEQALPQRFNPLLHATIHTRHRQLSGALTARGHQIADRLRTGEIKATIEHRSLAELTGLGATNAGLSQHPFQHALDGHHSAVTMDLHHVFTREAARRQHQQHQHFIDPLSPVLGEHMAIQHPMALPGLITRDAGHRAHCVLGLRTRQTNHCNAALTGRHGCCHGRNRQALPVDLLHCSGAAAPSPSFLRSHPISRGQDH